MSRLLSITLASAGITILTLGGSQAAVVPVVARAFLLVLATFNVSLFGFGLGGVGTGNNGNSTSNFAQHSDE